MPYTLYARCSPVLPSSGATGSRWQEAADALKLTSDDLLQLGVVDEVVPEPGGAAHEMDGAARQPGSV